MTVRFLSVAAALLAAVTLFGCSHKDAVQQGPGVPSQAEQIQQIQNNPHIPAGSKAMAIAAIKRARAATPQASQPQAPKTGP